MSPRALNTSSGRRFTLRAIQLRTGKDTMEYVRLGSTGMTVSRICLGCMSYGNPGWRPWVLSEEDARPFFRYALDNGINFFDTADMYSLGVSEEVTGRALRSMAKLDEVVIAT